MNRPAAGRLAAYAAVVLVGAGGLWRVENTAHEAQHAADKAQEALDQLEAERHDRCVNGRHDTQRAFTEIVNRLAPNMAPARREQFEAVLHETLSTKDC